MKFAIFLEACHRNCVIRNQRNRCCKGESVQDYLPLSFERLQGVMCYIIPNFPAEIACNSRNRC